MDQSHESTTTVDHTRSADAPSNAKTEQQHCEPSVDPAAPTLLLTGFPNVGKSTFMSRVTSCGAGGIEARPCTFMSTSLYVGHTKCSSGYRWQVIDTAGLLDHPLEGRSATVMETIFALANLKAARLLFFVDLSEQCGYTIDQQLSLLRAICRLFSGSSSMPPIVVLNKCDVCTLDALAGLERTAVLAAIEEVGAQYISTCVLTDSGAGELKEFACSAAPLHK